MIKLLNCNSYSVLPSLIAQCRADGQSVAIITDPPYEFNNSGGGRFRKSRKASNEIVKRKMHKGFDDSILFMDGIGSVVCFMHNDQVFDLGGRLKAHYHRAVICGYSKTNPSPMANRNYRADCELFIHAWNPPQFPTGTPKERKRFTVHSRDKNTQHPAQKPLDLMRKIVRTTHADVIIDPFMGSGSTGLACRIEGRSFIGVELDSDYFKIAHDRIGG